MRSRNTSRLEGNTRRASDLRKGDQIDENALQSVLRAAVFLNASQAAAERSLSRVKPCPGLRAQKSKGAPVPELRVAQ